MLTRAQIQRLAQRHRVGMQVQERDYVQHLLLGASEYDDVPPFVVSVLTPEHLLAEKVRALIVRAKPRDLYDVWLLLAQGVTLERGLVEQKLTLCGLNLTTASLEPALSQAARDWARDLRPLLPQYADVDVALRGIVPLQRLTIQE